MILLLANASVDAGEEYAVSVSKIKKDLPSTDRFQTNGSDSDHCIRISNFSPKQDHHYCSRSSDSCPNWFVCNDTTAGMCQCGPEYYDNIKCNEKKMVSAVLSCFCVTSYNDLYSGYCFYNCERKPHIYNEISNEVNLNEYMCGRFNRTGISCGQCKNGTSPFVLSYNMSCVECPEGHKNWWKFALVGFVPLTVFYFFSTSMLPPPGYMVLYSSAKLYLHLPLFVQSFLQLKDSHFF